MLFALIIAAGIQMPPEAPKCTLPFTLSGIDLDNKIHAGIVKRAHYKCRRDYPNSPCLKRLYTVDGGQHFNVICGAEK